MKKQYQAPTSEQISFEAEPILVCSAGTDCLNERVTTGIGNGSYTSGSTDNTISNSTQAWKTGNGNSHPIWGEFE